MTAIRDQLPLVFETRNACSFDTLVAGDNELAVGIARQCAQAGASRPAEKQILVWADSGCGKSHLLQACCQLASNAGRTVCYLPAREISDYDAGILDGMERLDLLCIDDADELLGDDGWEVGLFDLINRCRDAAASLIISTRGAPEHLRIGLADLRSRLQWGPVFQLRELDDDRKIIAMQLRANQKGLVLDQRAADYLLHRFSRDMASLFERLDQLDKASLAAQRRLTVPFIRSILDQPGS